MSVGIECPVCEAIFKVKQVSKKTRLRCPECKRKFRYSEEIQTQKKSSNLAKKKVAEKPISVPKPTVDDDDITASQTPAKKLDRSKKKSKWKTVATDAPRLQTPKPAEGSSPALAAAAGVSSVALDQSSTGNLPDKLELGQDGQPTLSAIQIRKRNKARRQTRNAIIVTVTLSIATAILGFVLYRQLNLPDQLTEQNISAKSDTPTTESNNLEPTPWNWDSLDKSSSGWSITEPEEPDEEEKPVELPRVLAADLPKREFEYLEPRELRSLWQRIRPRLISFTIRTDLGDKQSVGTIVDSRGWTLTSNQLVSKWPDVSATAAARNIDAYYNDVDARKQDAEQANDSTAGQKLLFDISKGIASAQPKRDQALLALNRRFVIALDKFEFASRNSIVAGMYLIQVAPPSPTNPYGFEEVKVHGRQEFEELEAEALDKAKALGIDDPLTTWVVTSKQADPLVGTPVFARTGKMVGTFAFSTKQFAYFVSAERATDLLAQAAESGAEKGVLQQVDATTELLSSSHPMARPSELLNRAGVACEAFGWMASDTDQYKQLQKFSRRFSTVGKYIQDNQDDASDSVSLSILSDQIKRWQRSLSKSIRDTLKLAPKKIDRLNAIALDKLAVRSPNTANTYIPFVAEIYSRGRDENGQDSVLVLIGDDLTVVKIPYSRQIEDMRPGSQWLCFYKRPSRLSSRMIQLNSGKTVPIYGGGKILTVLGPIEKR